MNIVMIFFLSFTFSTFAQASILCLPKMSIEEFNSIVLSTRLQYFPELNAVDIKVTTFKSDAYFLQAQPVFSTLTNSRNDRQYTIQLNLKLLECPPSDEALKAILVNELEHVKDYTKWSSVYLMNHGLKYFLFLNEKSEYERMTDLKVLKKGLHEGLASYREWVYQWLSPKELKKKRTIYLTPEEIRSL